jgi:hypothetical protein
VRASEDVIDVEAEEPEPAHRWVPGRKPPRGPNPELTELRALCRSHGPTAIVALVRALEDGGVVSVAAAKVLLEYGYGRPHAAPEDLEAARAQSPLADASVDKLLEVVRGASTKAP